MTYNKPEVSPIGSAMGVVQSVNVGKKTPIQLDSAHPRELATNAAYEADE